MKILILVLSFDDNNLYTKFYEAQKNTWDSDKIDDVDTFYYFGNHSKDEIIGDKIFVNTGEGVPNCGYKTIKAFELIKNLDFDFVFRTNATSYIDKKMLLEFIKTKPKDRFYSGYIGFYEGIKFASGSGYFISKDIIDIILNFKNDWNHDLIDDVALSKVLLKNNIIPTNNIRYDVTTKQIPMNFFHYRLKTDNREFDIENMYLIKKNKDEFYNRKQI